MIQVKYYDIAREIDVTETLDEYCLKLGKKNNALLYEIEKYLGKKMLSEPELSSIRKIVLDTSRYIQGIPEIIVDGNDDL